MGISGVKVCTKGRSALGSSADKMGTIRLSRNGSGEDKSSNLGGVMAPQIVESFGILFLCLTLFEMFFASSERHLHETTVNQIITRRGQTYG
uniref:Uncharacterized protein n=1 Tax=Caenorhabditis japonica TaxID=281687 RepID=A0A8R1IH53_CAEJA